MVNCPLCNTQSKSEQQCPNCGWDLSEFPPVFEIPEAYELRLRSAATSAQQGWKRAESEAAQAKQQSDEMTEIIDNQFSEIQGLKTSLAELQELCQELQRSNAKLKSEFKKVATQKESAKAKSQQVTVSFNVSEWE